MIIWSGLFYLEPIPQEPKLWIKRTHRNNGTIIPDFNLSFCPFSFTGYWCMGRFGAVWCCLCWVSELFTSRPAGDAMITTIWTSSSSWSLTALPLFIWMGEILFRTRLSEDMFRGLSPWMARLPGGLVHTNIVGCTVFAAVSGSSAATLTTVGKMAIPELRKRQYPEYMIIGTLTGAATLGLMIPPSLTLIVYVCYDQRIHYQVVSCRGNTRYGSGP